jgi:hypothetical protein
VRTTYLPRPMAPRITVTVNTTSDSGIKRKGVHHHAPSTSRETAATGVDGGRRLFHTTRPTTHHQQEYPPGLSEQQATQSRPAHLQPHRISASRRTTGHAGQSTHLQPHRISASLRTTGHAGQTRSPEASLDLCAMPDNQLPRTHSLACSYTGPLRIFADRLPGHPDASSRPPRPKCSTFGRHTGSARHLRSGRHVRFPARFNV